MAKKKKIVGGKSVSNKSKFTIENPGRRNFTRKATAGVASAGISTTMAGCAFWPLNN